MCELIRLLVLALKERKKKGERRSEREAEGGRKEGRTCFSQF
jgi:hypothetical protein